MIDIHIHILPAIDDGSKSLDTSLEMARQCVQNGVRQVVCTPHIYPGLYENTQAGIQDEVKRLQAKLNEANIPLTLFVGADVHATPDVLDRLKSGEIPTINGSKYLLLEPSHFVATPNFYEYVDELIHAGYVPVITHPERLHWIDDNYALMKRLVHIGAMMQITASSLTGKFGLRAQYWAQRMLVEGLVHIVASDAHSTDSRPPDLQKGFEIARMWVGEKEALRMVELRPRAILNDVPFSEMPKIEFTRTWWKAYANRLTGFLGIQKLF